MGVLPFCCLVKLTYSICKLQKDLPGYNLAIDFSKGCIDEACLISALNVIGLSDLPGATVHTSSHSLRSGVKFHA